MDLLLKGRSIKKMAFPPAETNSKHPQLAVHAEIPLPKPIIFRVEASSVFGRCIYTI